MRQGKRRSGQRGIRERLRLVYRALWRFLLLLLLWGVLTEGYEGALWFGLPVVTAATLVSLMLHRGGGWRWNPVGMMRFLLFFLSQSMKGAVDVARRALNPRLPLAPQFLDYPLRLPDGPARVFLANTISLLPGTCSIALENDRLRVHVLDGALPVHKALRTVEERVALLFGLHLS